MCIVKCLDSVPNVRDYVWMVVGTRNYTTHLRCLINSTLLHSGDGGGRILPTNSPNGKSEFSIVRCVLASALTAYPMRGTSY
jgi:hypothetical protein